jgi:hypothetical protein
MMILPVSEVMMLGVFDANIPNSERIVMVANEEINLSAFCLVLALAGDDGLYPLNDHFYWFGPQLAHEGDSIVLFTGSGANRTSTDPMGKPRHLFYWSKPQTLFADQRVKPLLFTIGAMSAGNVVPVSYPQEPKPPFMNLPAMPKLSDLLALKRGLPKKAE